MLVCAWVCGVFDLFMPFARCKEKDLCGMDEQDSDWVELQLAVVIDDLLSVTLSSMRKL